MSDEALNKHLGWLDKCAEEQPDELERTCYACKRNGLCYLKRDMEDLIRDGLRVLNIDGDGAPGHCHDELFGALAKSCMLYEENAEDG